MKKIIYFFLILFCFNGFSQKADITSAIIALDNKQDLESAKKWIDEASEKIESGSVLKPKIMAKYYHYKGLIYLKHFQKSEDLDESRFDFLDIASNAFLKDAISKSNLSKKSINH